MVSRQLERRLLPFGRLRTALPFGRPRPARGAHWLIRRFYRYEPGAILALFALPVALGIVLDFAVPPIREWLDKLANHHEVGVNLSEHLVVTALAAAAAYYWVLGFKRQRALKRYRDRARKDPEKIVEWSRGKPFFARRSISRRVADSVARSEKPTVGVVHGRPGSGRTSFLVELVRELARESLIPIAVHSNCANAYTLEELARSAFCRHVEKVLGSDREREEIWHRAKATRDVVILVDGLDDEAVEALQSSSASRKRFKNAVEDLGDNRIGFIFATTSELPLGELVTLREDLDFFGRGEARNYLETALDSERDAFVPALAAVERLYDPVDGFLIAPFYLDVVARLEKAGVPLGDLPEQRDLWRAEILAKYLDAVGGGGIVGDDDFPVADRGEACERSRRAKHAAETFAREVAIGNGLTIARDAVERLCPNGEVNDAGALNLLSVGEHRVGFAADDLGAYLLASQRDAAAIMEKLRALPASGASDDRRARPLLRALIFWHLRHQTEARETFDQFLGNLEQVPSPPPSHVSAAVRIANACNLSEFSERLDAVIEACIKPRPPGLLAVVRALAEWPTPSAHLRLWELATNQDIEVEWPAAKALAMAKGGAATNLQSRISDLLKEAAKSTARELSEPDNELGNSIGSLAWILPAMRDNESVAEQLSRVAGVCLDKQMSPLRGEMSLAQGLKLAILNERAIEENIGHVRKLLSEQHLRFWHARLVLVHALLAWVATGRDHNSAIRKELEALWSREHHPLVGQAIDIGRQRLRDARRPANGEARPLADSMWSHERDAVKWIEQRNEEVTQLAGDVVLLSNMIYRLRSNGKGREADAAAVRSDLPQCIRRSCDRERIIRDRFEEADGTCGCAHGLCQERRPAAVCATRARFSESFCREQARLVSDARVPPPWMRRGLTPRRNAQRLSTFWETQAQIARSGSLRAKPYTFERALDPSAAKRLKGGGVRGVGRRILGTGPPVTEATEGTEVNPTWSGDTLRLTGPEPQVAQVRRRLDLT